MLGNTHLTAAGERQNVPAEIRPAQELSIPTRRPRELVGEGLELIVTASRGDCRDASGIDRGVDETSHEVIDVTSSRSIRQEAPRTDLHAIQRLCETGIRLCSSRRSARRDTGDHPSHRASRELLTSEFRKPS